MAKTLGFSVYVPVGPGDEEVARAADLVESLCHYEQDLTGILLIDDDVRDTPLESQIKQPRNGWLKVVPHPLRTGRADKLGGVCAADLVALSCLNEHSDMDFVIKCDTDALVIRPFGKAVGEAFRMNPFAGMLGVLGTSCNRKVNMRGNDGEVLRALAEAQAVALGRRNAREILERWRIVTDQQKEALRAITVRVSPLLSAGYAGQHCQGGAYAVSGTMIRRMAYAGYFRDAPLWSQLPFGEDRMMGLYCALVELDSVDSSMPSQPFGIQNVGLPHPPNELVEMGYSIVHSLRNNQDLPEQEIRQFFRDRRACLQPQN